MKYILTTLTILLSSIAFAQKTTIKLLDTKYYYESSESKTYYKRLVSFNGTTYYAEGHISFDNEGRTIQKLDKFKKKVNYVKIKNTNYTSMLEDYEKMAVIQFTNAEGNEDKIRNVVARLDEELMIANIASDNGLSFDNGVGIAEYFLTNSDAAFQKIFNELKDEKMIDDILLGHRVYMDGDDYNIEIFYPLKYEGTFWGF